ncbi:MAG: GAF domain-containing sensor histidine kinase [Ardenticatenaceae bacterium]|nr:GAF domain-containing sensor histidine kinase [Ardenticatenaceae bacterium]
MNKNRQLIAAPTIFFITFALLFAGATVLWAPLTNGAIVLLGFVAAVAAGVIMMLSGRIREQIQLDDDGLPADAAFFELTPQSTSDKTEQKPVPQSKKITDLENRLNELKMLRQFAEAMNFTINFDAMLWLVYTHSQDILNPRDFNIYLTDPESGQLYTAFCVEEGDRCYAHEGLKAVVADTRISQIIDLGLVHEHQDRHGRYWITAPLNAGAETVGAIQASHVEIDTPFDPHIYDLFARLAYNAASAFDHHMTNQRLQVRARQLETLMGVIHSINAEQDVESLLDLMLEKAIELLKVEAGSILLVDEEARELEFKVVHSPSRDQLLGTRLPVGKGIAGQVAQTQEPIIVNDVDKASHWFSGVDAQIEFKTYSILTVPLIHQKEVWGVVQVVNKQNGAEFTDSDLQLLTAFAGEASVALKNADLLKQTDAALQERVKELSLLREVDRDLNQDLDMNRTLQRVLNWVERLFDASAGYVVLFDPDGNHLACDMRGYSEEFSRHLEPWHKNDYPGLIGHVLKDGQPLLTKNTADVDEYFAARLETQSQMTLPIIQDKQIIGAIAIEHDQVNAFSQADLETAIGLVNHMTAALANACLYLQVHEANNAKSEFVSIVSHELKTPLASIRGYAGLMKSGITGDINDQQGEFLETIDSNVSRMATLIQDLTDVSRIDTGQLRVKPEPIPFTSVINETIQSIRSLADQKGIEIELNLLPNTPIVMGDHARLVQVMTNLISNACKYSPENTKVNVNMSNSNGLIKCAVQDHGYGISPEDQEKLFTKFFRSSDPNIRRARGTGLGLSITRALVELHGGNIGFDSAIGEGTTFWFTLPLAPTPVTAD